MSGGRQPTGSEIVSDLLAAWRETHETALRRWLDSPWDLASATTVNEPAGTLVAPPPQPFLGIEIPDPAVPTLRELTAVLRDESQAAYTAHLRAAGVHMEHVLAEVLRLRLRWR